jgi:hypothetical protein
MGEERGAAGCGIVGQQERGGAPTLQLQRRRGCKQTCKRHTRSKWIGTQLRPSSLTFRNALFSAEANHALGYTASSAAIPAAPPLRPTPALTPTRRGSSEGPSGWPWNSSAATEPGPRRHAASRRACSWRAVAGGASNGTRTTRLYVCRVRGVDCGLMGVKGGCALKQRKQQSSERRHHAHARSTALDVPAGAALHQYRDLCHVLVLIRRGWRGLWRFPEENARGGSVHSVWQCVADRWMDLFGGCSVYIHNDTNNPDKHQNE